MLSLEVEQLSKSYNRRTVLNELSFTHSEGILGISGANGSGKSTLMKCLAFLTRGNKGTISWKNGDSILEKETVRSLTGYAAPYINLYDELTISENLEFIFEVSGLDPDPKRVKELIEFVQMNGFEDQLFKQLSTGQQQRVKIATALVRDPDILFLDEPGSNLDERGHELVSKVVKEYKAKDKLVVIASNDPKEIGLCDNVVNLSSFE